MSISSVNRDFRGDCPVWRSEVAEFFSVEMEVKVSSERGLGIETIFHPPPRGDSIPENK
jgi:hypothetical protein